jgi:glucose 1-dehydrogenase
MSRLANKRVLITGGSSGIGQAIAIAYANEGAKVVFNYHHNYEGAQKTLNEIAKKGLEAHAVYANLNEINDAYQLLEKAILQLQGIDILINNAGTLTRHTNFMDISLENFEKIQAVNIRAPFILLQETARQLQKQNSGGCIINVSSISAKIATSGLAHYECSKAALNALTRAAAQDLSQYNIRVNAIEPGLIGTNINKLQREQDPSLWKKRNELIPLGKSGNPEDIANVAIFLASKDAEWITGSTITVDGGISVLNPFTNK